MNVKHVVIGNQYTDMERERILRGVCVLTGCETSLTDDEKRQGSIMCAQHEQEMVQNGGYVTRIKYILTVHDATVGQRVARWDGSDPGTVFEIDGNSVIVDLGAERTPGLLGSRYIRFLPTAIMTGALVVNPDAESA